MADISKTNIVRIDLGKTGLVRNYQPVIIGEGDSYANTFGVEVYRDNQPVDLTGVSVTAYFMRPNHSTVIINGGLVEEGSIASVTLPQACYAYDGVFSLAIKLTGTGSVTGTVRIVDGSVINTTDGPVIDPGTVVPTLDELLAKISACEAATEAAEAVVETVEESVTNAFGVAVPAGYKRLKFAYVGSTMPYVHATFNSSSSIRANQNSRAIIRARQTAIATGDAKRFFGSRYSLSSRGFTMYYSTSGDGIVMQYGSTYFSPSTEPNFKLDRPLEAHTFELNAGKAYVDGVLAHEWEPAEFATPSRPQFGSINSGSSTVTELDCSNIELYELEYWVDASGSMTSHLLPYERISDGAIGFYDHVTGNFFEAVRGEFETGGLMNIASNERAIADMKREILNYVDEHSGDEPVPQYIKGEVDRVCGLVRSHQAPNSLTWLAASDFHCLADTSNPGQSDMASAAELIRKQLAINCCVSHGDIIYRMSGYTDYDDGVTEAQDAVKILGKAFGNCPQIRMVGNHDANCANGVKRFPTNDLNGYAGAFSSIPGFVYGGIGYGYADFPNQKVRLIALNTSWFNDDTSISSSNETWYYLNATQAKWLCSTLDMSDKSDADEWCSIVMSHVAIDANHSNIDRFSGILDAYIGGTEYHKTASSVNVDYDFAGKNAAKLIMHIAGHAHYYKTSTMVNTGTSATYPLMRLLIPNVLNGREGASDDGVTYTKTAGTKDSTSFCVNVLDRDLKVLNSIHYGAGFDRTCHYEPIIVSAGSTEQLASVIGTDWTSEDESICTVVDGLVTGVSAGSTTIHARNPETAEQEIWLVNVQ